MSDLVLYEVGGCPFCIRVRNKLEELDLEYESVMVPRAHANRTEVKEISGQTGVPVLVDEEHDVHGMPESTDIIAYLEETYGDGAN
jgi:glutathione S-transferase